MTKIILLSALVFLSACGSGQKAEEAKSEAKEAVKTEAKKAEKKVESKARKITETMEEIVCSYGTDQRVIKSVKVEGGGCEVHYEKFGSSQVVATAKYDLGFCSQRANKISNNLEEANFNCK